MKLLNNLYSISASEKGIDSYKFFLKLNADHPIYSYHFPGNPITPGVCILQMLSELLELVSDRNLKLKSYVNVKYLNIISPKESSDITIEFSVTESQEEVKVKAIVKNDRSSFAKISALYV